MLDGIKEYAANKLCNLGYESHCPVIEELCEGFSCYMPSFSTIAQVVGVTAVIAAVGYGASQSGLLDRKKDEFADADISPVTMKK